MYTTPQARSYAEVYVSVREIAGRKREAVLLKGVPKWIVLRDVSPYSQPMRMRDLSPRALLAVACPKCGAPVGKRCLLYSGGMRNEPHVDRKLSAIEALEAKGIPPPEPDES
jgi:hypothetical protein